MKHRASHQFSTGLLLRPLSFVTAHNAFSKAGQVHDDSNSNKNRENTSHTSNERCDDSCH